MEVLNKMGKLKNSLSPFQKYLNEVVGATQDGASIYRKDSLTYSDQAIAREAFSAGLKERSEIISEDHAKLCALMFGVVAEQFPDELPDDAQSLVTAVLELVLSVDRKDLEKICFSPLREYFAHFSE